MRLLADFGYFFYTDIAATEGRASFHKNEKANEKIISLPPSLCGVCMRAVVSLSRFRATTIAPIIAEKVRTDR